MTLKLTIRTKNNTHHEKTRQRLDSPQSPQSSGLDFNGNHHFLSSMGSYPHELDVTGGPRQVIVWVPHGYRTLAHFTESKNFSCVCDLVLMENVSLCELSDCSSKFFKDYVWMFHCNRCALNIPSRSGPVYTHVCTTIWLCFYFAYLEELLS